MSSSNGGVPPGFRFHPTDEELLHYYLKKKVSFHKFDMEVIREVDLNKIEPWDLQEKCKIGSTPQNEWYFFSHKDRKYPTGSRTNRATNAGFWKATGRDKCIRNSQKKIGMRKTLVFYRGRAPHGQKTDWIMHEYRLEDGLLIDDLQAGNTSAINNEDGWVVCRVFKKKNLFKVVAGNHNGIVGGLSAGSSSIMNPDNQLLNNMSTISSSTNLQQQPRIMFMQREHDYHNNQLSTTFELINKHELGIGQYYPHDTLAAPAPHYSLFQSHHQTTHELIPTTSSIHVNHKPLRSYDYSSTELTNNNNNSNQSGPVMVKQLLINRRDCSDSGNESLHYQGGCDQTEAGLEVGTCESTTTQQMIFVGRSSDHHEGMSSNDQWAMLDRLAGMTSHLGNQDSSKEVKFLDGNNATSSPHQINQPSFREEMNFWGYEK